MSDDEIIEMVGLCVEGAIARTQCRPAGLGDERNITPVFLVLLAEELELRRQAGVQFELELTPPRVEKCEGSDFLIQLEWEGREPRAGAFQAKRADAISEEKQWQDLNGQCRDMIRVFGPRNIGSYVVVYGEAFWATPAYQVRFLARLGMIT